MSKTIKRRKFNPKVGMTTQDSYLHGINTNEDILKEGIIEHVGIDYFVLRIDNEKPVLVRKDNYWCIEEEDFTEI